MINGKEVDYFDNLMVGQEAARRKLSFLISNYYSTGYFPPTLLTSPRGFGKSMTLLNIAKLLYHKGTRKIKPYLPINASEIIDVNYFFTNIVPHLIDKDITISIDEASMLPKDVQMMLLNILNITDNNINEITYDNEKYVFNMNRISWLFASTSLECFTDPFKDRIKIIQYIHYSIDELAQILIKSLKDIKLDDKLASEIPEYTKGTPRDIQKICKDIHGLLNRKNKKYFSHEDWKELMSQLSLNKYGIEPTEIELMRAIKHPRSLTSLASFLCLDRTSVQRGIEPYLHRRGLIQIENGKRSLSFAGRQYIRDIENKELTN